MRQSILSPVLLGLAAGTVAVIASGSDGSVLSLSNVVAYTGNQIPGMAPGVTFGALANAPSISSDGHVVFGGAINGVAAVNNQGAFSGTSAGTMQIVAQSGTQAPGAPAGATMDLNGSSSGFQIGTVKVNAAGVVSYVSLMTGGGVTVGTNNWGVFSGTTGGSFGMLARSGIQVPAAAPGTITANQFSTGTSGLPVTASNVLYYGIGTSGGDTVSGSNNSVLLSSNNGTIFRIARQGEAAPGSGGNFGTLNQPTVLANPAGQLVFSNTLTGGTVTTANDAVLYRYTPGTGLALAHREGDVAPGTTGAVFSGAAQMFNPSMNAAGQAILGSTLAGGDVVGTTNDFGVFVTAPAGETMVWRKGTIAPGTGGATFLNTNGFGISLSNGGKAVVPSTLVQGGAVTAANDAGLWWGTPGTLSLLAREGDTIPTINAQIGSNIGTASNMINALDQIVFMNTMTSSDTNLNGKSALLAYDPGRGIFPIAFAGEQLEVAPGVFRTISSFTLRTATNSDGSAFGLSDTGLLAVRVTFSDTTSAIVTYAVPAPGAAALAMIGAPLALRRRRNR